MAEENKLVERRERQIVWGQKLEGKGKGRKAESRPRRKSREGVRRQKREKIVAVTSSCRKEENFS